MSSVMRELNLILRLIQRIEQEGRAAGAVRVSAIRVKVGVCSGVEPSSLRALFDSRAQGTLAQGASLTVESVGLESQCDDCGGRFPVVNYRFQCPVCLSQRTRVVTGEEFVLESVTVVTECDPDFFTYH